jgi:hypothetical protein
MRTLKVSAAVAAILASAGASAASVDLYVSGASAQRTFWSTDLQTSVCGGNSMTTYSVTGAAANPDNQAYRCTADGALTLPANVNANDIVTLHYSAELGSVSGISPFLPGHNATRLFVNPDSADCSVVGTVGTCTITSYSAANETFASASGDALVQKVPDAGATDVDPVKFAGNDNWLDVTGASPAFPYWGPLPTIAQLQAFQSSANQKVMNGQVFMVIVNPSNPIAAKGNISKASATAIFAGQYQTWGQVPEVGGGNTTPIKVCRREHGSGTQVSASIFFTGTECGVTGASRFVSQNVNNGLGAKGGPAGGVQEDNTTGKLNTCVLGTNGAIGFRSIGSTTATILTLDGVEANAHNAAAGMYPYAFETWTYDNTATSGASPGAVGLYNTLVTNARRAAKIPAENGSQIAAGSKGAGQWTTTAPKVAYALAATGFGNTKNITNWVTTSVGPTAFGFRSGDACRALVNVNPAT